MIIDIISDLHGSFPTLEGGDLLILGGDYTANHTWHEHLVMRSWLHSLEYKKKVMIGGNHDTALFGSSGLDNDWLGATWLYDSGCEFEGLKIWGSPWTAWFEGINPKCTAWTLKSDKALAKKWNLIPDDIDILITHSPPYGILDECCYYKGAKFENVGSKKLLSRVQEIKPKLHIFGHIHERYGREDINGTIFINASHMAHNYHPINKPVRIEV